MTLRAPYHRKKQLVNIVKNPTNKGVGGGDEEGGLDYVGVEVVPRRVGLLDKFDLPGAIPFLESTLAGDGGFHGG